MNIQEQVQRFIDAERPAFVEQVLVPLDMEDFELNYERLGSMENTSVDLRRVVGMKHPNYGGCTYGQLVGKPFGNRETAHLQRIRGAMLELLESPEYYSNHDRKSTWGFWDLDGRLFCVEGAHRTAVGRYVLEAQRLEPMVHGVNLTTYRHKVTPAIPPVSASTLPKSFLRRLFD